MAIQYTLMLDTPATIPEVAETCRGSETVSDEEALPQGVAFWLSNLRCTVMLVDDRTRDVYLESFGIAPAVSVGFRIDKDDPAGTIATAKRAAVRLLRGLPDDAILVQNGEVPVLRRAGGRGVINQDKVTQGYSSFGNILAELGTAWTIGPDPGPVP